MTGRAHRLLLLATVPALAACLDAPAAGGGPSGEDNHSIEFFANAFQDNGIDRVWIPALGGDPAGELGSGAFTVDLWIKVKPDMLRAAPCSPEGHWYGHNTVIDRESYDMPRDGNIGLGVWWSDGESGMVAGFQVAGEETVPTLCGDVPVVDDSWHHVAFTRDDGGGLALLVDGQLDASISGPPGDASAADEIDTDLEGDRFMVVGGDKFDLGEGVPGFGGWIDDLRLSREALYDDSYELPTAPPEVDESTLALFHFDEGDGKRAIDQVTTDDRGAEVRVGGSPAGPAWSDDDPF